MDRFEKGVDAVPSRNFSMARYWEEKARDWRPELSFAGKTREDWEQWRERAYPRLLELLGAFPAKVDLRAEVEYAVADGDLIRERVVFDSEEFMSVPCQVLRPKDMKADRSHAAILCAHGHGSSGKDAVAGVRATPEHEAQIKKYNYNYAEQMAREGFLTIAPDLRVFGERADGKDPFPGKDACDVNFDQGALLGIYPLTLNIWDLRCCLDYLETRPEVDPGRLGMMGLSFGGTVTAFTAAVDRRIKAADISGYVNSWAEFGLKRARCCGSQIVPGIFRHFDTHDIAGLIAPRPLLLEMGLHDQTFLIQDQLRGFAGVQRIYAAAGCGDKLEAEMHQGGHAFAGGKAFEFFRRYL